MRLVLLGGALLSLSLLPGCGSDAPPQRPTDPDAAKKAQEEMMRQHQQEFKDRKAPRK
jgi:hypothetical protein